MAAKGGAAATAAPSGRRRTPQEQTAAQKKATDNLWFAADGLVLKDIRAALEAGADPLLSGDEWTAAMHVIVALAAHRLSPHTYATRQVAALRLLAKYGGLDAATATGALATAVQRGHSTEVVQTLLDAGADPRHADEHGRTALHYAHRADVVRLLVAAGGDVTAADVRGCRPLLFAVSGYTADKWRLAAMSALIAAGAPLDAVSATGATALSCSVRTAETHMSNGAVKLLLEAGADPTIPNLEGQTPLAHAVRAVGVHIVSQPCRADMLAASRDSVRLLARAEAWWRRRHALLAFRGRRGGAPAGTAALAAAAGSSAGASGRASGSAPSR